MTPPAILSADLPRGPIAAFLFLGLGLLGILQGLFAKEFRKGRFGQGDVITTPWRVLRDRIGWCLWGIGMLYFSYRKFGP